MAAMAVMVAGTGLYLAPSIVELDSRVGPDLGDPLLNLYFVTWGAHVIESGEFGRYWSPPFFHPSAGVLNFSDHLVGPAVAVWVLGKAGAGPVAAFNLLLLASFALTGWMTWWLLRQLGASWFAAVVGGWVVAFGHYRWGELSHYQVLRAQWIPWVLWTFDRLLERPTARRALPFLVVYTLHLSGGTYLAYLVHFAMLALLVVRWRSGRIGRGGPKARWALGVTGAAALVLLAVAFSGYVQSWGEGTAVRRPQEIRQYGATLASFATPAAQSALNGMPGLSRAAMRGTLFLGFVPLMLGACGALLHLRRKPLGTARLRRRLAGWSVMAASAALVGFALWLADRHTLTGDSEAWLSAIGLPRYNGPRILALLGIAGIWVGAKLSRAGRERESSRLGIFERGLLAAGCVTLALSLPIGFTTVHRWLPGMAGMRVSHRSFVFVALAVGLLAARGFDELRSRLAWQPARIGLTLAVLGGLVLEMHPGSFEWAAVASRPDTYPGYSRWIAGHPEVTGYAVLPFYDNYRETLRMHHQTLHWRPLVNGYSASFPRSYRVAREILSRPPAAEELAKLRTAGISHLVVDRVDAGRQARGQRVAAAGSLRWLASGQAEGILELRYEDAESRVYGIGLGTAVGEPRSGDG